MLKKFLRKYLVYAAVAAYVAFVLSCLARRGMESASGAGSDMLMALTAGICLMAVVFAAQRREAGGYGHMASRECLFRQILANVDEVFIVAAGPDKFNYVSDNSGRVLNIETDALATSPELLYREIGEENAGWLRAALTDQSPTGKEKEVFQEKSGKTYRIQIYPASITQAPSESHIVSISDQTVAARHQQALSDALEAAHAASAAKSSFLSHMSHEIRTPMNAIIGMTTIALSRINDQARVEDCLAKIAESSRHLLGLINDVLDMSKIENGKLAINHENFNLHRSVENISNILQQQTRSRHQNFEILLENVEDEDLIGDPLRLNQVLLNVLSNACKFTPPEGTITLKIQQLRQKHNTTRFRFIIQDTGIGMSEEFLRRIYEPFEQAAPNTAAKYGGTGLGMPITYNLVSLMGGVINVESKEGAGTKFTIELPFGLAPHSGVKADVLPRLKVLIVDDDHGTCEHAALLLEKMGLNACWTLTGREAVEKIREAHEAGAGFDVCLIDWKMPDMDGAETARRIRAVAGDDMLIIIISAYDWTPIEDEARAAGVNDFVAKPFFASTLFDALLSATRNLLPAQAQDPETASKYNFAGRRILLVEDNEFNREIGQEFLEMANAEVDNAENGKEAVEKVLQAPPGYYDLVLMDVQMPQMNGYDATKAIRSSDHPDAKKLFIIAMTANAFSEDVATAVAAGMNGHISKPIDVNELHRMLAAYFRKLPQVNGKRQ